MTENKLCFAPMIALALLLVIEASIARAVQPEVLDVEAAFARYEIEDLQSLGLLTNARSMWSESATFAEISARLNLIAEQDTAFTTLADALRPGGFGPMQIIDTEDDLGPILEVDQDPNLLLTTPEQYVGSSQILPVSFLTNGEQTQRAVGRISATQPMSDPVTGRSIEPGDGIATGFKIGPRLLMTNAHVPPSEGPSVNHDCVVQLPVRDTDLRINVEIWKLDPEFFWHIENDLDIAIVGIAARPVTEPESNLEIKPIAFKPHPTYRYVKGMVVNVIQHPEGKLKKVALHDNRIVDFRQRAGDSRFRYTSDTQPGSSGSPLFDNSWQLIGLHRASGEEIGGKFLNNEGIRIDKVVQHLNALDEISGRPLAAFKAMLSGVAPE